MGLRAEVVDWIQAGRALIPALGKDADFIRQQCETDQAVIYRFNHHQGDTWVVLRGEDSELVVVAMAGAGLHQVAAKIIESARVSGFASLRCHTKRPGMARMLIRYGATVREVDRDEIIISLEF